MGGALRLVCGGDGTGGGSGGPAGDTGGVRAPVPLSDTGLEAHARSWPEQVSARLPAAGAPAVGVVEACTTQGDPSTVLLKRAAQAVLLGLGNTRRSALGSALVGSVATRRIHRARCPVVLMPGSDASPRGRSP
ncbi:universal stress protein [Pseudonocardia sp. H11422]|uniref:universal stress protein n=1 Tax=Pseudonocardia sp. H11422 TaxID=2835866 RepID=UPI003977944B